MNSIEVTPMQVEHICAKAARYGAFLHWMAGADEMSKKIASELGVATEGKQMSDIFEEVPEDKRSEMMQNLYFEFVKDEEVLFVQGNLNSRIRDNELWDMIELSENYIDNAIEVIAKERDKDRKEQKDFLKGILKEVFEGLNSDDPEEAAEKLNAINDKMKQNLVEKMGEEKANEIDQKIDEVTQKILKDLKDDKIN